MTNPIILETMMKGKPEGKMVSFTCECGEVVKEWMEWDFLTCDACHERYCKDCLDGGICETCVNRGMV